MDPTDLARIQFASTSIYHFLFVPVTIGLAFLVAVLHTMWYRSGNPEHRRLTKFFGTLLLINVAVGVVTGLVQEFQFGMNWSAYSRFVGDVFGAPLAMEGLAAFFLESTFLGLWVFGWNVLPRRVHLRNDLAGRVRRNAVGGVHHGRELLDAAPGGLHDRRGNRTAGAQLDRRRVHEPGLRLGLRARAPRVAGDRRRRDAGRLGVAPPSTVRQPTCSGAPPTLSIVVLLPASILILLVAAATSASSRRRTSR